ncbi:hypothetical protein C7120_07920 [Prevotella sp. oral taxon 376]|uniref:hypothetical protein n=1 Tax=Prevotella sp. oral taxon 376 TaxID=712466 RepID=UPI000D1E40FE|nr:hypothetical protein [Prevotella sp. oral taxon 376]PTL34440.1 hypothetical protein C7120_07920 [Prevotella sp. oral taxon 376]
MKDKKAITIKTLNKSNVWDLQENDIFRLWEAGDKEADFRDNIRRYTDIIRSAFEIEEIKIDKPGVLKKYEERGFKIGNVRMDDSTKVKWAIKKRPITRVTDLTYENIHHISAAKLIEVLDRNFGSGWESLPQNIKDIIEKGFDISTTTLPQERLHKVGGMYEKKVADGFEVLEIPKGTWVEAIFAKAKPEIEKLRFRPESELEEEKRRKSGSSDLEEGEEEDIEEREILDEDDEDAFDEDKFTEESYRTTFDADPDDLSLEAEDISEDDGVY